jgi:2-polyprenyl-3-methyl-5-hydroxy-6-metoxy-1,4-benzoquinol methylase
MNINTREYWEDMYSSGSYPSQDVNNQLRFRAAAMVAHPGKLLDVGGGDGALASHLSESIQYTNFDLIYGQSIDKGLPYKDKSFTTVTVLELLERVEDPGVVLLECWRVCSTILIVSLPLISVESAEHLWYIEQNDPELCLDRRFKKMRPNNVNIVYWTKREGMEFLK